MSTIIMAACWPLQGMSPVQKSVLISLADNANDEGVCWPSVATISRRTCVSERSVQAALRWLEENGFIRSHQRHGRSTWYTVTPADAAPRSKCTPADAAPPPPQMPHPTPADAAPRTVKEPSGEPSYNSDTSNPTPRKKNQCPVKAIVDLFNEMLPELPAVVLINKSREASVKARWNESEVHQDLDFWREFFGSVHSSDFLMGKIQGRNGGKPFRASFDWLIAPSNFVKVVEGNYHA